MGSRPSVCPVQNLFQLFHNKSLIIKTCPSSPRGLLVTLIITHVKTRVIICFLLCFRSFSGRRCSSTSSTCCCRSFSTKVTTFFRRKSPLLFTTWPLSTLMPSTLLSCQSSSMAARVWTLASELFSHATSSLNG